MESQNQEEQMEGQVQTQSRTFNTNQLFESFTEDLLNDEISGNMNENVSKIMKYSPYVIRDYYRIGENMYDHIEVLKNIFDKERENWNESELNILKNKEKIIRELNFFLSEKKLGRVIILKRSLSDMFNKYFVLSNYQNEITKEVVEYWSNMDTNSKIVLNIFISLFIYNRNMSNDKRIGYKLKNSFFMVSFIHFGFEIVKNEKRLPTNLELYEVCVSLSELSNQGMNYTIDNVNNELKKHNSKLRLENVPKNSILHFYSTRCPCDLTYKTKSTLRHNNNNENNTTTNNSNE
jgi:hypothetical protein